jgi:hypothetical protein
MAPATVFTPTPDPKADTTPDRIPARAAAGDVSH